MTVPDFAVDVDGGVLLAGSYAGTADLDPTEGLDEHTSAVGSRDGFVIKIDADGAYAWIYFIGGPGFDSASKVAIGTDGTVLVIGGFQGTVDFDPTDGVDEQTADEDGSSFLVSLGPSGNYVSTLLLPYRAADTSLTPDGALAMAGSFVGTIDFDPGKGTDYHVANGASPDVFVTRLEPDGTYGWTGTFRAAASNAASGIAVDADGNIFVTGTFRGTVDFDPTTGVDQHTMVPPYEDVFITKLYPDGSYAWTRTYDPWSGNQGHQIAVGPDGGPVIIGAFEGTVDFDPTSGVDLHTSVDVSPDVYVSKVKTDGSYAWTYTVGGPGIERGRGVGVDAFGNVFATGAFSETVDFDPGPDFDFHASTGREDLFVTMLGSDGTYAWTRTIGGPRDDWSKQLAIDSHGGVFIRGTFRTFEEVADFDPGCEVDEYGVHFDGVVDEFITKLVCVEPSADFDGDGVVNLRDFAAFQSCFTGEAPTECGDGCSLLDLDDDDDIDLSDFADFRIQLIPRSVPTLLDP